MRTQANFDDLQAAFTASDGFLREQVHILQDRLDKTDQEAKAHQAATAEHQQRLEDQVSLVLTALLLCVLWRLQQTGWSYCTYVRTVRTYVRTRVGGC